MRLLKYDPFEERGLIYLSKKTRYKFKFNGYWACPQRMFKFSKDRGFANTWTYVAIDDGYILEKFSKGI